ncbi:MAG: LPS export ABC transporter periplasmic protein LptC [Candidatus Omnitrophica bacterium]|nr:LPS export ABC transporter periplasmic protein LptC [Candidatus Omnitrophota bacterium]
MIKKFIITSAVLIVTYLALIQGKLWYHAHRDAKSGKNASQPEQKEIGQHVYSFSFSKYTETGKKELEIEGDSADIFSKNVGLMNVIAKAYAEESPVTITADQGSLDRSTSEILLNRNVVATTENGTRLMTEQLEINPTDKRMESQTETKVKKDNIHIEGMGATSDSELSKVTFKKNVTVVIQDPDSDSKAPTVITSDGPLEVDYKRNVAHFTKNVVANHAQGTLTADYIDVIYQKDTRRVSKMIARGNVIIVSKEGNKTFSDNAVYLAKEGRIVLGGDVEAEYRSRESGADQNLF